MTPFQIVLLFIAYSIIGWTMDAAFRSVQAGKPTRGGFSRYPFSPVYGLGAFLALGIAPMIQPLPLVGELIVYAFIMGAFEYVAGVVVIAMFNRRLWSYFQFWGNIDGHTAPSIMLAWGTVSLFIVYVLQPLLMKILV